MEKTFFNSFFTQLWQYFRNLFFKRIKITNFIISFHANFNEELTKYHRELIALSIIATFASKEKIDVEDYKYEYDSDTLNYTSHFYVYIFTSHKKYFDTIVHYFFPGAKTQTEHFVDLINNISRCELSKYSYNHNAPDPYQGLPEIPKGFMITYAQEATPTGEHMPVATSDGLPEGYTNISSAIADRERRSIFSESSEPNQQNWSSSKRPDQRRTRPRLNAGKTAKAVTA